MGFMTAKTTKNSVFLLDSATGSRVIIITTANSNDEDWV